jgi:WD40 repeat protein
LSSSSSSSSPSLVLPSPLFILFLSCLPPISHTSSAYFKDNPSDFSKGAKPVERVRLSKGHSNRIEALCWAQNDPEFLLTAGQDSKMLLWHGPSGNKLGLYRLKSAWVQACGFRYFGGENAIAASGGMDNIVSIFSSRTFLFFLLRGRKEGRP